MAKGRCHRKHILWNILKVRRKYSFFFGDIETHFKLKDLIRGRETSVALPGYVISISVEGKVLSLISRFNLTLRVARVTVRCRLISNQRQEVTVFY